MSRVARDTRLQTFARQMRTQMTDAEQLLWQRLRNKQLLGIKFRRQQPIASYIVDFVSMDKMLVIELDGGQHGEQLLYDTQRSACLQALGYRVLRFWNHEVLQHTDEVLETILKNCLHTPTPTLPRKRGREMKEAFGDALHSASPANGGGR